MGRDRVLDDGIQLASGPNTNAASSLAGKRDVRQTVGGANRGTVAMVNESHVIVRRAAGRLVQTDVVREEGAEAAAREEYAA